MLGMAEMMCLDYLWSIVNFLFGGIGGAILIIVFTISYDKAKAKAQLVSNLRKVLDLTPEIKLEYEKVFEFATKTKEGHIRIKSFSGFYNSFCDELAYRNPHSILSTVQVKEFQVFYKYVSDVSVNNPKFLYEKWVKARALESTNENEAQLGMHRVREEIREQATVVLEIMKSGGLLLESLTTNKKNRFKLIIQCLKTYVKR